MRVDCHVHIDRIGAPHKTPPPTVDETVAYTRREEIGLIAAIYEQDAVLETFREAGIDLFPFFWVRSPREPKVLASARGLKLHPYIDRYTLTVENVLPSLLIARERNLPLLVHTDDREPHLSRGALLGDVARQFPDLKFILAHSGAYAPGDPNRPGESYVADDRIRELVSEAIAVAEELPNVWLETSVLASRVKAQLLATTGPVDRIVIGSDFPICKDTFGSVVYQEERLVEAGFSRATLERIHVNARDFLLR
jgi:predicted TIM-barrel fold metal-dependent hydrolase